MVVHAKPTLPAGHGELVMRPPFAEWAQLAASNHSNAAGWSFEVAGLPANEVRAMARREALAAAAEFSARMGVEVDAPGDPNGLVVATGHQPALYHPGVWIKDFLLQRLAEETGASALDLVVDSDAFETVSVSSPCLQPDVHRCTQYLAVGTPDSCFACASVPAAEEIERFRVAVDDQLATLPAPSLRRHFGDFAVALAAVRPDVENLAELITFARRRVESQAGSRYLELPVTTVGASEPFAFFVADIALNADRFADAYNRALADYRIVNKTRSAAQPFPDLAAEGGRVELPLWLISRGRRTTVWAEQADDGGVALYSGDDALIAELSGDPRTAAAELAEVGAQLAPKALALTLFARAFVCDLFIHGVGGGGYDRVTDGVFRAYYGVEPPAFVVASITMYLPLGAHIVTDDEVSAARERLNRLDHNPDSMLAEVEFDSVEEQARALELANEKSALVGLIAAPDADKKSLGLRIREVNSELSALLQPLKGALTAELANLESQRAASEILTDRTYPFCFWSPQEVADKAR
jgi:hypothetical protein